MKTAQPQSFPPGVSGSGGINRSTKASTAALSSGAKNTHGPGLTAWGGSPPTGRHGNPAPPGKISARAAEAARSMAVEASNARLRVIIADDADSALLAAMEAIGAAGSAIWWLRRRGKKVPTGRDEILCHRVP